MQFRNGDHELPPITNGYGEVNLSALESHLWQAANILRGPVDAADFKTYIFPLLFFKRISDVYDEEFKRAVEESGGDLEFAVFAENHRFQIPDGCHWRDITALTVDVGRALEDAFRRIEHANPQHLGDIFGDAQWANKDRLSDELLVNLVDHFSKIDLSNARVSADIAGQAYEYLIKKFADATKRKAGEFYTPRSVVHLMTRLLDPQAGETIYDPACGTGGMLLEAVNHVREHGQDIRRLRGKLFGQEKNLTTWTIAKINLFLHGIEDFDLRYGDTLRNPAFFDDNGRLKTFDCVIANPPFSLAMWGDDVWMNDPYGRNFAGLPPKKCGDFAWVQHMIRSMDAQKGRMAIVLPHGALFRMGSERRIRTAILDMDLLDMVIGLAPNLFYGTGLAAAILVLRHNKPQDHKRQVLMIDASKQFGRGKNQNTLEAEHVSAIHDWCRSYRDIDGIAKVVSVDEIASNDYNLNISRYIEREATEETISLGEALKYLEWSLEEAYAAENYLEALLREARLMS